MKRCLKCGETKSVAEFYRDKSTRDGLQTRCKVCQATAKRERVRANPEKSAAQYRKWYVNNNEKVVANNWKRNYGITPEEYAKMFVDQGGRCAGCGRRQNEFKVRLGVDHNHETGEIRGLLCKGCNLALGHVMENTDTLRQLIGYLEDTE